MKFTLFDKIEISFALTDSRQIQKQTKLNDVDVIDNTTKKNEEFIRNTRTLTTFEYFVFVDYDNTNKTGK